MFAISTVIERSRDAARWSSRLHSMVNDSKLWIDFFHSYALKLKRIKILLNYDKIMRIPIGLFKGKSLNLK